MHKLIVTLTLALLAIAAVFLYQDSERQSASELLDATRTYWVAAVENAKETKPTLGEFFALHRDRAHFPHGGPDKFLFRETIKTEGLVCPSWSFEIQVTAKTGVQIEELQLTEIANCQQRVRDRSR